MHFVLFCLNIFLFLKPNLKPGCLMRFIILLIAGIICCKTVVAQDTAAINKQNKEIFLKIIQQKNENITDSVQQTLNAAKKIKYNNGQAEALKNYGLYYYFKKNYDSALYFYKEGIEILKDKEPTSTLISLHINTGVVLYEQAKYKEAIEQYLSAKTLAVSLNDSAMMVKILINLSNSETTINNTPQALQTITDAIKWNGNNKAVLPNLLVSQAALFAKTGDTVNALKNYKLSADLLSNTPNLKLKANTLNNYGNLLYATGDRKAAETLHNEALAIFETINDTEGRLTIMNQMANNAFVQGNYAKALSIYKEVAIQADDNLPLKRSVYTNLVLTYKNIGDYKNAFESLNILNAVNDSISNTEIRKTIEKLKTENAVQQAEIKSEREKLTLSNRIVWLTIGLIVALCIIGIVLLSRQKQKLKAQKQQLENIRQKSELEMQLFRTQMNPHFFFNALYSIQNYMLTNNALQSSRYLGKFARLARAILEGNAQPFVPVEKELSILEDYLSLEQLRFEDKFTYNIYCDEEIAANYQIPTMVLQPFIENAIIHGLAKTKYDGVINVNIDIEKNTSRLVATIDDNGTGIQPKDESAEQKAEKKSMALALTKKRLELLSAQYKNDFHFEITDKKLINTNDSGVKVVVYLPLIEQ